MRENYIYFSNYTYQSKEISIPIQYFPSVVEDHCKRISVTFDLEYFEISILYLEIHPLLMLCYSLFPVRESVYVGLFTF